MTPQERKDFVRDLIINQDKTFQEVGDILGVSRQRAQQIFVERAKYVALKKREEREKRIMKIRQSISEERRLGNIKEMEYLELLEKRLFYNGQGMAQEYKCKGRQKAHSHGVGLKGEQIFIEECKKRNIEFKDNRQLSISGVFDFEVNNKKIEIKASNYKQRGGQGGWGWTFKENDFDILFCVGFIEAKYRIFIFPKEVLSNLKGGLFFNLLSKNLCDKYIQYEERWDLIMG